MEKIMFEIIKFVVAIMIEGWLFYTMMKIKV